MMHRLLSSLCLVLLLAAPGLLAQEEQEFDLEQLEQLRDQLGSSSSEPQEPVLPPQEPMTPREELFLAIEIRDVEAARRALEAGADEEINVGSPGALATAALYNDLRMIALLLDFGGDPGADRYGALEEAVRHENVRMVELLMGAGARLPEAGADLELFRLAQRGDQAGDLSRILVDHGADPTLCLAAATADARIDLMKYCLSRGAGVNDLPAGLNALRVALASGDSELVRQILEQEPDDALVAGAVVEAVAAGNMDLVRRAVAGGVRPEFRHVEAAVDNGRTEIGLFLLEQGTPDDPWAAGDSVQELSQRASDLGLDEVAAALRHGSGLSFWSSKSWLLPLAGILLAAALGGFVLSRLIAGRQSSAPAVSPASAEPVRQPARPSVHQPAHPPSAVPEPLAPPAMPAASQGVARPSAGAAPAVAPPVMTDVAATIPVGSLQGFPAPAQAPVATQPSPPPPVAAAMPIGDDGNAWQLVPEPAVEEPPAGEPPLMAQQPVAVAAAAAPAVELRMPEVDLSRAAAAVFAAARQASSGETVRPDAPDRRQLVLVTPARVTMLHSCPAPGSLPPQDLVAAEGLAPASAPRNVAVIAYTDFDPMTTEIASVVPFFDLLQRLGYLGHAVWIFEGHVSAVAAGCQDADVLIVDDGMMPYLPGNWRSVATRSMRGSEIHVFERKTGSLRRLA